MWFNNQTDRPLSIELLKAKANLAEGTRPNHVPLAIRIQTMIENLCDRDLVSEDTCTSITQPLGNTAPISSGKLIS
ncbi:hypothetical protein Poly59_28520 [Rubripirellula reticaptiva]|uniref:Uncharacterized protein n=1 Tax=Rubripirellula reticaptiva TaxID=2528013 RepID=A0A5C6ESG5_9BACT|nr:hypothetical protein Poly59_28520 [Rubripirellula reticaptiva]